ncbi:unnamed protein product, partial [Polarella glacialis]
ISPRAGRFSLPARSTESLTTNSVTTTVMSQRSLVAKAPGPGDTAPTSPRSLARSSVGSTLHTHSVPNITRRQPSPPKLLGARARWPPSKWDQRASGSPR